MFRSKWTLCDVYMEASYVLSGLSAKCDLKLIAPKRLPCTCPATCSQNNVLHKSALERPDVACNSTNIDNEDSDVDILNDSPKECDQRIINPNDDRKIAHFPGNPNIDASLELFGSSASTNVNLFNESKMLQSPNDVKTADVEQAIDTISSISSGRASQKRTYDQSAEHDPISKWHTQDSLVLTERSTPRRTKNAIFSQVYKATDQTNCFNVNVGSNKLDSDDPQQSSKYVHIETDSVPNMNNTNVSEISFDNLMDARPKNDQVAVKGAECPISAKRQKIYNNSLEVAISTDSSRRKESVNIQDTLTDILITDPIECGRTDVLPVIQIPRNIGTSVSYSNNEINIQEPGCVIRAEPGTSELRPAGPHTGSHKCDVVTMIGIDRTESGFDREKAVHHSESCIESTIQTDSDASYRNMLDLETTAAIKAVSGDVVLLDAENAASHFHSTAGDTPVQSSDKNIDIPNHVTWNSSKDLPLMANVDDVLVSHYILDLDVDFEAKMISGSIILFIKPARTDLNECNFQLCLDSTMVTVEAAEEVPVPDDLEIHFHEQKCCCFRVDSSDVSLNVSKRKAEHSAESPYDCFAKEENVAQVKELNTAPDIPITNETKQRILNKKAEHSNCSSVSDYNLDQAFKDKSDNSRETTSIYSSGSCEAHTDCHTNYTSKSKFPDELNYSLDTSISENYSLDESLFDCENCQFLHDLRASRQTTSSLKFKKLSYSMHGWCIRVWKEGENANVWPRCVRIWYHTSPEGQSIMWAKDQDGK